MYACVCAFMCVCVYVCVCMYVCMHVCMCVYVCRNVGMYVFMCVCVCMYVCMYLLCVCVCMYVCIVYLLSRCSLSTHISKKLIQPLLLDLELRFVCCTNNRSSSSAGHCLHPKRSKNNLELQSLYQAFSIHSP
jgi:hypothetical protein